MWDVTSLCLVFGYSESKIRSSAVVSDHSLHHVSHMVSNDQQPEWVFVVICICSFMYISVILCIWICELIFVTSAIVLTAIFLFVRLWTTHTHTRLTALFPGQPGWAGTRKVQPIWILLKQETVSGNGIHWAICKSAPCSRQITTPAPHHSVFLQAGCPSYRPANSVKALKG